MKKILFPILTTILLTITSCDTEVPPVLTATIADSVTVDAIYCHTLSVPRSISYFLASS